MDVTVFIVKREKGMKVSGNASRVHYYQTVLTDHCIMHVTIIIPD